MQFRTKRNIDISVWYAEKIMQDYSDPYDAIEWLVMHLGADAFDSIAETYDAEFNDEIELSKQRQSQYKVGDIVKYKGGKVSAKVLKVVLTNWENRYLIQFQDNKNKEEAGESSVVKESAKEL